MTRKTEKITVSLPAETLQLAEDKYRAFGFENRSAFIDAAIREYVSRDLLRQFSGELAALYGKIERSEIKGLEEHLSKLSYKIAVELAQINLLLASLLEVPYPDTQRLRGKAVRLVGESRGYVPLKDAICNRMDIHYLENDE
ncbi:CopG family ribbon-helix-helix protein [Ethanoligenens harbinense]|uniref:Ribbon-helix-helix protein CopG domain-containing protein n=1 Tax=Ethanoligenens harbinense (strain DSM 18485 / JCM 12961 / CGMCC 1.5033 / YUAN-3) TaxID=663278 RepID=E6U9N3_ETHHY|nr:ribbon-helix-helix domain-containing protein [Ethanoligenens harbinense]ADU27319.1 hypothetical protein Ethha_1794 [Ethanoligenens harbinense YUAN-3]